MSAIQTLRNLPSTRWFAGIFALPLFGLRPFQAILNLGYVLLSDVRPLFGCESCGTPGPWVKPIHGMMHWVKATFGKSHPPVPPPHFSPLAATGRRALSGKSVPPNAIAR